MQSEAVIPCLGLRDPPLSEVHPGQCVDRTDTVQVWWVPTGSAEFGGQVAGPSGAECLSELERERAGRFRCIADRRRFVCCRLALRQLLGNALDTPPEEVLFVEESYGKLAVEAPPRRGRVSFNVSHSGDWGCIVLAGGPRVGVDVEGTRRPHNLELLAKKVFTDEERRDWSSLPREAQEGVFLRYWTLKEAVAKATGWGLRLPLARIPVHLGRPTVLRNLLPDWHREEMITAGELSPPQAGYYAALAVGAPEFPRIEVGMIDFRQAWKEFDDG